MKTINWIKENLSTVSVLLLVLVNVLIAYLALSNIDSKNIKQYLSVPLSQLKFGHLIVLVVIHAVINRSDK